jgi:hypothetical protein
LIRLGHRCCGVWYALCIREKAARIEKAMLRIDTIETSSAITLELHGRLTGPWVPLLEASWKSAEGSLAGRTLAVNLAGLTAIDGAARYLLRLMEAKNVTLSGGGIGIRALLGDEGGKQNEIR